ncbi:hypothetical protein [Ferviditalea candida]|uniref:Uncharacterized protein n=1 Tax=Ferviditalea candida TaxID=3108399 RepID=A0ABU5ZQR9_9BACL|nr:hypothetical protein [Paenibacillaceae bacterium T2]
MKVVGKFLFNSLMWLCEQILVSIFVVPMFAMMYAVSRTQSDVFAWLLKKMFLSFLTSGIFLMIVDSCVNENKELNEQWEEYKLRHSSISSMSLDEIKENLTDFSFA